MSLMLAEMWFGGGGGAKKGRVMMKIRTQIP